MGDPDQRSLARPSTKLSLPALSSRVYEGEPLDIRALGMHHSRLKVERASLHRLGPTEMTEPPLRQCPQLNGPARRVLRLPPPDHPVADLSRKRIKRRPVLRGLINE